MAPVNRIEPPDDNREAEIAACGLNKCSQIMIVVVSYNLIGAGIGSQAWYRRLTAHRSGNRRQNGLKAVEIASALLFHVLGLGGSGSDDGTP